MKIERSKLWPFILMLGINLASGTSNLAAPNPGFNYDKIVHFLVFGLVATSIIRIPFFFQRKWKGALWAALIVSLYGICDEYRQSLTPGRSVEFNDWLADTLGALTAVTVYLHWPHYRKLLERDSFAFLKRQPK